MERLPYRRTAEKMVIRLPDGLRSWIAEEARRNLRSANAQAVLMLQMACEHIKPATGEGPRKAAPAAGPNDTALAGGAITHG